MTLWSCKDRAKKIPNKSSKCDAIKPEFPDSDPGKLYVRSLYG